jgi:hypothetical protein
MNYIKCFFKTSSSLIYSITYLKDYKNIKWYPYDHIYIYTRTPDGQNLKNLIYFQKISMEYKNIKYIKYLYYKFIKIFILQRLLK